MADVLLLETGDRLLLETGDQLLLEVQSGGVTPDADATPYRRSYPLYTADGYDLDGRVTYRLDARRNYRRR